MGEMTSAEIGSIRARVVLVIEFPRVVTISIHMFLATGPVLMIGGETLEITIRRRIKIGAVGTDGTSVVKRHGGGVGALVTEILREDENQQNGSWFFVQLSSPFPPSFRPSLYLSYPYPTMFTAPPSIPPFLIDLTEGAGWIFCDNFPSQQDRDWSYYPLRPNRVKERTSPLTRMT